MALGKARFPHQRLSNDSIVFQLPTKVSGSQPLEIFSSPLHDTLSGKIR